MAEVGAGTGRDRSHKGQRSANSERDRSALPCSGGRQQGWQEGPASPGNGLPRCSQERLGAAAGPGAARRVTERLKAEATRGSRSWRSCAPIGCLMSRALGSADRCAPRRLVDGRRGAVPRRYGSRRALGLRRCRHVPAERPGWGRAERGAGENPPRDRGAGAQPAARRDRRRCGRVGLQPQLGYSGRGPPCGPGGGAGLHWPLRRLASAGAAPL